MIDRKSLKTQESRSSIITKPTTKASYFDKIAISFKNHQDSLTSFTRYNIISRYLMGNSSSNSLHINLNESSLIVAGSTLSGTISAVVPPGGNASSIGLSLYLIGKEDVCVRYNHTIRYTDSDGNSQTRTEHKYSYSKRDIVRTVIPLLSTESSSAEFQAGGQYAVPFQVQIPDNVPSSMMHGADGGHCNIVYKLKAEAKGGMFNPKQELPLTIVAKPPSSSPVPNLVTPVSTDIKLCCCIHKGTITIAANVDDTRVGGGEILSVDFGCKNEASADLKNVIATIKQEVRWSSHGHSSYTHQAITQNNFSLTDEMRARSKSQLRQINSDMDSGMRSRGMSDDMYREILAAVRDGSNKVRLLIPFNACSTYQGSLIEVQHYLTIEANTGFGSTNPKIRIPLQIVTPEDRGSPDTSTTPSPANVTPLSGDWTTIQADTGGGGFTSYGGDVVDGEGEITIDSFDLPTNIGGPTEYSLPSLLREIKGSMSVKSKLEEMIRDDEWKPVLSALQPQDVVAIIKQVTLEFDQADVTILVASVVDNFTCAYTVTILRSVSDWMRIQFVQKLISVCTDLRENQSLIVNELSDWERVSTELDFADALKDCGGVPLP
jgi:hypothetical protein